MTVPHVLAHKMMSIINKYSDWQLIYYKITRMLVKKFDLPSPHSMTGLTTINFHRLYSPSQNSCLLCPVPLHSMYFDA